ncbi:MAG: C69 family dipeptidase [Peptoniphilus sp.]|uniref:C69 family dipeptidase n=1 Tax=Peptoniphilus sp. TaxID=1971214 RepID=UPI0025D8DDF9|nr:C69 family dipeptidase [Peptoniphilus sp.]MCI5642622.1 C69 family dipeptidase [Peptoniphilus sp.]MDD7352663.1 C69 family dipeptidase [Peptoniphilaceae bacterium]
MKNSKKKLLVAGLASTLVMSMAIPTFACTGIIVGKDLTADGSFIFGRTEDYQRNRTMRLVTHPRGEFKKGSKLVDVNNGFEYIHPEDSLKFFSTPDSSVKPKDMEQGVYDAAGYNEAGVGIFCTVSADPSEEIEKTDPFIKNGVNEASMTTFLLAHAKSAKGAIELLADTIDKQGASMGDIVAFGDQNEVWYMEIYSGHQYVAIKYPADKFSIFPNDFWLGGVDLKDKENVIASKDIVKIAKDAKTYKETEEGLMDMAGSYGPKEISDTSRSRIWSGIHDLDPNSKIPYDAKRFDLLNDLSKDSEKITIDHALNVFRNRFEGTDYIPSDNKAERKANPKTHKRPIGSINTMQAHIFQIKDGYPKDAPGIMWMTLGSPLNIPWIPIFPDINDSTDEAKNNSATYDANSYYWVGSSVNDLVSGNREELGEPTRKKINEFEEKVKKELPEVEKEWIALYAKDKEKAAEFSTAKTMEWEKEVFELEKSLQSELSKVSKADLIDHWARKPIIEAINKKLMVGTSDLYFSPNEKISRGEFITILGRLGKVDTEKYTEIKDKNIEAGKFYTEYMNWAVSNNLLPKTSKAIASEKITREEMAHILASYLKLTGDDTSTLKLVNFADEKEISDWAYEDIQFLANKGILTGTSENKFSPKANLTRAEVAQIISKLSK